MKKKTPSFWRTELIVRRITFVAVIAAVLIVGPNVFGKTASCPCSPCKCSPCTCGAGGPSKGGKHHEKERGHEHGGVGVGVNVDLGGVGQRRSEPDPFAVGGGGQPVAHTQEKPKTKKESAPKPDAFSNVELTGEHAKDETGTIGGGAMNVSNDTPTPLPQTQEKPKEAEKPWWAKPNNDWVPQMPTPGPQTQEKPKETEKENPKYWAPIESETPAPQTQEKPKEKVKHEWPKPIKDWIDAKNAADSADWKVSRAREDYDLKVRNSFYASAHWVKLTLAAAKMKDKVELGKLSGEKDKLEAELRKDYQKTEKGQKAYEPVREAEKAAETAHAGEADAGKNIDQSIKDSVQKTLDEEKPAAAEQAAKSAAK